MRLHCAAAWSRPGARPFSPLRAPWALGRAAPGARSGSFGTGAVKRPPRAAPGFGRRPRGRRPSALRPVCGPLRLPVPRPSSALVSVARARGFGLLGGPGVRPLLPPWAVLPPSSLGFRPPPPLSPGFAWRRLRRRCFSYSDDVASFASLGSSVRPGRDSSLPLNDCFPCPSSFAIDLCCPGELQ